MNIPTTLKHKPVFVADDYEHIDGGNAYSSEAKGLSLGLAQWNDRGKVDISAKIWRYTGEKWSRQSEEMPLHRVLDLTIFVCEAINFLKDKSSRYEKGFDPENPIIDRVGLQGDAMTVSVCTENPMIDQDMKLFREAYSRDDELISERLHILADILREAGY